MDEKKPFMSVHKLNRTLKRMFRISECGLGIFDTSSDNGQVEFYWQISPTQSFYITTKADVELVEAANVNGSDTKLVTIKELLKTEVSDCGVKQDSGMSDLKVEDFIDTLKDSLDKTNSLNYRPFDGVATIYEIRK